MVRSWRGKKEGVCGGLRERARDGEKVAAKGALKVTAVCERERNSGREGGGRKRASERR